MKTKLPTKSKEHKLIINDITNVIVSTAKDKIAFVILFGSFARGDWVYDSYVENHIRYTYASDYDILIVTKSKKQGSGYPAINLKYKITANIEKKHLDTYPHKPHIIIESLDRLNYELERSQYFFKDIKKERILLYKADEKFELAEPRELSIEERKRIAKDDYNHWFKSAREFFIDYQNAFKRESYKKAAFELHQTTERLYVCALLVLTGYKPKSHDLTELGRLAASQSTRFLTIFPQATEEQKKCFDLLRAAYIEARYSKDYKITKEQLEYLAARVEKLKAIVKEICKITLKDKNVDR